MRLEIKYKEKNYKSINMWMLNTMVLDNQWVNEEIKEEIKKYLETNENGNTMIQDLWGPANIILRIKFRAIQAYLKKQEKSQINHLTFYLKELKKKNKKTSKLVDERTFKKSEQK